VPRGKVCGASLYICFCMAQVPELNNKFLLSGGFILAIISTTFVLTREYMLIHELQEKVEYINERATRLDRDQQEEIDELKDKLDGDHR
jgi:Mg2+ and Co2+ transporter CorA